MSKKIRVGSMVRFISEPMHNFCPSCFPPVGTIGKVLWQSDLFKGDFLIAWADGTTSNDDRWLCNQDLFEVIDQ